MSKMIEEIASHVFGNGKASVPNERLSITAWQCQLLLKWLSHPVYVNKQRLAKISGCSLKEIEKLIQDRTLPVYLLPGSKRPKFSLADLIQAMERHKMLA